MTDWSARDINMTFDFLPEGYYKATICKDGVNAERHVADYILTDTMMKKTIPCIFILHPVEYFLFAYKSNDIRERRLLQTAIT